MSAETEPEGRGAGDWTCTGCGQAFSPSANQRKEKSRHAFCRPRCQWEWQRGRYAGERLPQATPEPPGSVERSPIVSFDQAYDRLRAAVQMSGDRYQGPMLDTSPPKKRKKILVIPDPHCPFHDPWAVGEMLAREADADLAVCLGDVLDSYSFSTFRKYERVPFGEELAAGLALVQTLSETFPGVRIIGGGNHDQRLLKRLAERLDVEMLEAVKFLTGGRVDVLAAICERFPNVETAGHQIPGDGPVEWFWAEGDALFCHAERYSRVPGSALRAIEEWFSDFAGSLGVAPYRAVFQGHTHTLALIPWRADKVLVECGTLARTMAYQVTAKCAGRPQRTGYVTFEQEAGVTDLNSIRLVWLDHVRRRGAVAA